MKQPYEIIENIIIYFFGAIAFICLLGMAAGVEGGQYIASILFTVGFALSLLIASMVWKRGNRECQ